MPLILQQLLSILIVVLFCCGLLLVVNSKWLFDFYVVWSLLIWCFLFSSALSHQTNFTGFLAFSTYQIEHMLAPSHHILYPWNIRSCNPFSHLQFYAYCFMECVFLHLQVWWLRCQDKFCHSDLWPFHFHLIFYVFLFWFVIAFAQISHELIKLCLILQPRCFMYTFGSSGFWYYTHLSQITSFVFLTHCVWGCTYNNNHHQWLHK